MQSIVIGDVEGNIALMAPGRVPVRSPENLIRGRAPVPGWLGKYDWQGFLPVDKLPRFKNPSSGALTTANARFLPAGYGEFITNDWAEHFRQARLEKLIGEETAPHDLARSKALQTSTVI